MTNLLRRALRWLLDFAYRLDREAMWQQWEAQYVQPLRGQVEILNDVVAALKDAEAHWHAESESACRRAHEAEAKLEAADKAIASLTKDFTPAWDPHATNNQAQATRKPWWMR